ncbi:MAG: transglutaminaseTgpA domain-containing protein [Planctomycetota bacterium]
MPILCALLFHAIALDRWLLVIPAMLVILAVMVRDGTVATTSRRWYVTLGVGLLVGLIIPSADVTAGPLPPVAAAAITGMAIAGVCLAIAADKTTASWVWAWALITVSGKTVMSGNLRLLLVAFLGTSLIAALQMAGLKRVRIRTLASIGLFLALLVPSTRGIAWGIARIDRLFMHSMRSFGSGDSSFRGTTGLGNSVVVSSRSDIQESLQPVLEMSELTGYLRTRVMDSFDGYRWTSSLPMIQESNPAPAGLDDVEREVELFFLQENAGVLPTPAGTTTIANADAKRIGGWIYQGDPLGPVVVLSGQREEKLGREDITKLDLLSVPNELAETLGFHANEIAGENATPLAKARAIQRFFHQNFEYSLTTDLEGDKHPLVTLVVERRPAYCVYFASAMTLMLRTQGVSARVVSGYVPGEVNPVSGRVLVRQRDAHAWVEVWDATQQRFIPFDPTPPGSLLQVLKHDEQPNLLVATLRAIRSHLVRLWRIARSQPLVAIRMLCSSPWFWLLAAALVTHFIRRTRAQTTKRHRVVDSLVDDRLLAVYQRYLAALQSHGFVVEPWETDEEVMLRLQSDASVSVHDAALEFLNRYHACRFGGKTIDEGLNELSELTPDRQT